MIKIQPLLRIAFFFFFPGKISLFSNKEIGKILDFFCFPSVNSTNFAPFLGSILPNFLHKKMNKKTLDANPLLKVIIKKTTNKTNNQVYVHHW